MESEHKSNVTYDLYTVDNPGPVQSHKGMKDDKLSASPLSTGDVQCKPFKN